MLRSFWAGLTIKTDIRVFQAWVGILAAGLRPTNLVCEFNVT